MKVNIEKQSWVYYGNNFRVETIHWFRTDDNKNKWNIYAYIYPKHPLFDKVTSESLFEVDLPLHCGASFHQWFFNKDGVVTSKKIGSDYQHIYDDKFESFTTKEDAYEVFNDADELIEYLSNPPIPDDVSKE